MKTPTASALSVALVLAVVCAVALLSQSKSKSSAASSLASIPVKEASTDSHRYLQSRTYCGCPDCTTDVYNSEAPAGAGSAYTCGTRMEFLHATMSNLDACHQVAYEFPGICGVCDPNTCRNVAAADSTPLPSLVIMGNDGEPSSAYPLGKCAGDCKDSGDCQKGLACYFRNAGDPVPGCAGEDSTDTDYCIDPYELQSIPPQGVDNSYGSGTFFRMKLYWRDGYDWQGERFERRWCMRCKSDSSDCGAGQPIYYTNCDVDSSVTKWKQVHVGNGAFMLKVKSSDLCLTVPSDPEEPLYVDYCNSGDEHQQFYAQNGDASWGSHFELNPAWIPDGCVGSEHHPKYGEFLYVWRCEVSRAWTTSAFQLY